jgi:hypothetical protein
MAKSVKKAAPAPKSAAKPRTPSAKNTVIPANGNGKSISHEQIAMLAHRFFAERGRVHGNHEEDWFRAEGELRAQAY